jgi:hypothetical protein
VPRQAPPPDWGATERPEPDYDSSGSPLPPPAKGFLGSLLDINFNYLVTPKLIKLFYVLTLMLISLSALAVLAVGLWIAQLRNGWLLGLLVILCSPLVWFFQAVLARIFMEAIIVRFKGVEYLRIMKDKGETR